MAISVTCTSDRHGALKRTGLRAAIRRWKLRRSGSMIGRIDLEDGFVECREALHLLWEAQQFTHQHPGVEPECYVCEAHEAARAALKRWR